MSDPQAAIQDGGTALNWASLDALAFTEVAGEAGR